MKLRTDFVTNSSSSSFLLARKNGLNEKQKQAIIDYVEQNFLGKVLLTPDSTEEEIQEAIEDEYLFEEHEDKVRKALKDGKTIYQGRVNYDNIENVHARMLNTIWHELERYNDGNFETIDHDLSY